MTAPLQRLDARPPFLKYYTAVLVYYLQASTVNLGPITSPCFYPAVSGMICVRCTQQSRVLLLCYRLQQQCWPSHMLSLFLPNCISTPSVRPDLLSLRDANYVVTHYETEKSQTKNNRKSMGKASEMPTYRVREHKTSQTRK